MQPELKDQDRFLPIANISRIMKRALPQNAKLSKESKVAVQECLSEFISFVTSEACERCSKERRKTINGEDLISALEILGFDKYCEPMRLYLKKFRDYAKQTEMLREKDEKDGDSDEDPEEDSDNEEDEEPKSPAKKRSKKKTEAHHPLKSEDSKSED